MPNQIARSNFRAPAPANAVHFLRCHSLAAGIALMFLFTWSIELSNSGIIPLKIPFVLSILLGWGFILASVIVTAATLGKGAVVTLLRHFLIWRTGLGWYAAALLLLPAMQMLSVLLTSLTSHTAVNFSSVMAYQIFGPSAPLAAMTIPWFLYEVLTNGEEMGWRGYILPRLQARYNALISSLVVGLVWSIWHLPKFLGAGQSADRSFAWFTIAHLALAVLYTWLYNSTHGSLLMVSLFHASGNAAAIFLPVAFAMPGGIAQNLLVLLYVAAAVIVILKNGAVRLSQTEQIQVQEQKD